MYMYMYIYGSLVVRFRVEGLRSSVFPSELKPQIVQGFLAYKRQPLPRTLK